MGYVWDRDPRPMWRWWGRDLVLVEEELTLGLT